MLPEGRPYFWPALSTQLLSVLKGFQLRGACLHLQLAVVAKLLPSRGFQLKNRVLPAGHPAIGVDDT